MKISIFLGPSLSIAEAQAILPNASFHPPAEQGDLLAAVDIGGAEIIGLIDGTFHQNLSVWHNEICYLLSRGIRLFGSSSMGALRAAETDSFGMIGIGLVYSWYRDGVVTADDEVALLHGDESTGYRPMSIPLVNIRASAIRAVSKGMMNDACGDEVIAIARSVYYPERQVRKLLQECRNRGFSEQQCLDVENLLTKDYVDQKRDDACELLSTVSDVVAARRPAPPDVPFEFARSSVFDALYCLDRAASGGIDGLVRTTMQDVAEHVALHNKEYNTLRRTALDREVVAFFARLLGLEITEEVIEAGRAKFLQERGLLSPRLRELWLRDNSMCEQDLTQYLADEALCHRLRLWASESLGFDRGCRAVLDELRIRGQYRHWVNEASNAMTIVSTYQDQPEYQSISSADPAELAAAHSENTGVHIYGDATVWAENAGFAGAHGLAEALRRASIFQLVKQRIDRVLKAYQRAAEDVLDLPDRENSSSQDVVNTDEPSGLREAYGSTREDHEQRNVNEDGRDRPIVG